MNVKALLVVASLGILSTGCESDCEIACERYKECAGSEIDNTFFGNADCGDLCDLSEEFAEIVGCEAEFAELSACTADNLPDEGCAIQSGACQTESERYGMCFDDDIDDTSN